MDTAAWGPWRALRQSPEIELLIARLPDRFGGGVYWPDDGWALIVLDDRLDRRERRAALCHEILHHERGGGAAAPDMPPSWAPVVARDERQVDDEVARRLVPLDRLAEVLELHETNEIPIERWQLAETFDVPEPVMERAMRLLQLRRAS